MDEVDAVNEDEDAADIADEDAVANMDKCVLEIVATVPAAATDNTSAAVAIKTYWKRNVKYKGKKYPASFCFSMAGRIFNNVTNAT